MVQNGYPWSAPKHRLTSSLKELCDVSLVTEAVFQDMGLRNQVSAELSAV